jgi:acyl-CoA synthetase (AMP-forming)/AMP-acid ligase II
MHPRLHAKTHPDKPALILASSGDSITYVQLESRANRGAHTLRGLGLGNGEAVAISCDNRLEFFDIYWAAQRAGLVLVLLSARLKTDEITHIVNDSGAKALLISDTMSNTARDVLARRAAMPGLAKIVTIGPVDTLADWNALSSSQADTPIDDEQNGGRMVYSSGTTGRPKGLMFVSASDDPVQTNPAAALFSAHYGFDADTVYLSPAPLYHSAPMGMTSAMQSLGATAVVMNKFDPEAFLKAIERYKITDVMVVPTMFIRLLALPEEVRARYDLSSLKTVIHAAAPCPIQVKQAMIDWLGPIIEEFYAGSEGIGFVKINSAEWLAHVGSVGRAVIGTVHICDDDGNELPVGATGTIFFSGTKPVTYHNDPAKTASARNPLHPEWSTMGDVGRLDGEGYLYLADRKDFMIISGGVNVYPQEVENLLITHPIVADVAVFGVPNHDFGEEVKAIIQPKSWADASDAMAAELIAWCKARLADVKCPRSVDFERELPRAETGKLYKKELRARYWRFVPTT